jgi:hypothetical protein
LCALFGAVVSTTQTIDKEFPHPGAMPFHRGSALLAAKHRWNDTSSSLAASTPKNKEPVLVIPDRLFTL